MKTYTRDEILAVLTQAVERGLILVTTDLGLEPATQVLESEDGPEIAIR